MLPDDGSPMVGCDKCDEWYHWYVPHSVEVEQVYLTFSNTLPNTFRVTKSGVSGLQSL